MPIYTVQAPNGKTYRIEGPPGATADQLGAVISQHDPGAGSARKTIADRAEGKLGTIVREAANAALPGVADRLSALTSKGKYADNLKREQRQAAADERVHPRLSIASSLAGAAISPLAELKGIGSAAYGAAEGFANSHGNALQRLRQTALGGAEGYVGGLVGQGTAKLAGRVLKPAFSKATQAMLAKGIPLTPGRILGKHAADVEETLSSLPIIRQLVKGAHDRGILEWNKSLYRDTLGLVGKQHNGTVGEEAISHVERELGKEYDRILPTLTMRGDKLLQQDLTRIGEEAKDLPTDARNWFNRIGRNRVISQLQGKAEINGTEVRKIITDIEAKAKAYKGSSDTAYREAAGLLQQVSTAMRANLERSNPAERAKLKNLNKAWAQFTRLQNASTRRPTGMGIITPGDLLQAAKTADKSLRKGSFARGTAMLQKEAKQAHEALTNKLPNSGTADRTLAAAALFDAPHLIAHAKMNPFKTLMALAAAGAYTKSGQAAINRIARTPPGKARNALAKLMTKQQKRFGTLGASGTVSGLNALAQFANGGAQ